MVLFDKTVLKIEIKGGGKVMVDKAVTIFAVGLRL